MLGARIANLKRWPLFIRLKDDAVNTQEMTSFDFTESKTRVIQMKTLIFIEIIHRSLRYSLFYVLMEVLWQQHIPIYLYTSLDIER